MDKLVSIILPTYNGSKWINKAIDSVRYQSYGKWELLLIDDGSTDNTETIITEYIQKDPRIRYIKNEQNLGIQKSLNRGLREAQGEYIARVDSDDIWIDKDKLKKQVEFLDKNSDYILVGTGAVVIDELGNEIFRYLNPELDLDIRKKMLFRNCFIHSSVLFKKDAISGYSEKNEVLHLEDYDLWLKLGTIGKMKNLPIYAVNFLLREDGLSFKNKNQQFKKNLSLIRKYKNLYPNYFQALIFNYFRVIVYPIFKLFPVKSLKKIMKVYKKN